MKTDLNVDLTSTVLPIQAAAQQPAVQSPVRRYAGPLGRVPCKVTNAAPGVNDDNSKGYRQFSQWIDTTGPDLYACLDATQGAAVWKKLSP